MCGFSWSDVLFSQVNKTIQTWKLLCLFLLRNSSFQASVTLKETRGPLWPTFGKVAEISVVSSLTRCSNPGWWRPRCFIKCAFLQLQIEDNNCWVCSSAFHEAFCELGCEANYHCFADLSAFPRSVNIKYKFVGYIKYHCCSVLNQLGWKF